MSILSSFTLLFPLMPVFPEACVPAYYASKAKVQAVIIRKASWKALKNLMQHRDCLRFQKRKEMLNLGQSRCFSLMEMLMMIGNQGAFHACTPVANRDPHHFA
ncbi:hypothetical protein HGO34_18975 [Agrobacterium vitis]|uniref:Uncharacterized protein n=1 Tax=Agrobacterium vitis TaxID=373 RepID=A0AAE5AX23_AGRVI|nr:hypothetical protein [Agrobacterium vitis]MCM2441814.1 hypothetical protein [Agrobacterium vitis]MUZ59061.1 hypothetical protein [Agrobacterium vitis]